MRASREPSCLGDRAERPEVLPHLMSGSKQDTETVHAFFQDMRACRLGDPVIVASVVRRVPSVQLRNACRARADRPLPSRLEHAPRPRPIRRRSASSRHACDQSRHTRQADTMAARNHARRLPPRFTSCRSNLKHRLPSIESLKTPTRSQSCACSSSIQVRHPTS